mmetsp:Transcript_119609/g.381674  ORF Transcript_119609/g.381674 Transcript_119609/m.381674 type:complete len:594 (-) Transcript_119609:96-1877(-)
MECPVLTFHTMASKSAVLVGDAMGLWRRDAAATTDPNADPRAVAEALGRMRSAAKTWHSADAIQDWHSSLVRSEAAASAIVRGRELQRIGGGAVMSPLPGTVLPASACEAKGWPQILSRKVATAFGAELPDCAEPAPLDRDALGGAPQRKSSNRVRSFMHRLDSAMLALRAALALMHSDRRRAALGHLSATARTELLKFMEVSSLHSASGIAASTLAPCASCTSKVGGQKIAKASHSSKLDSGLAGIPSKAASTKEPAVRKFRARYAGCGGAITHRTQSAKRRPSSRGAMQCHGARGGASSRRSAELRGVKTSRKGFFQAWVCFERIMMRSPMTTSSQEAIRFRQCLDRIRQLATAASESEKCKAGVNDTSSSLKERLACALAAVFSDRIDTDLPFSEEDIRYSTYVSAHSWVGRVDTPTTGSLDQVMLWHKQLARARSQGWLQLRAAWVKLLQEGRSLPGGNRGVAACRRDVGAEAAREYVDGIWQRQEARRKHVEERACVKEERAIAREAKRRHERLRRSVAAHTARTEKRAQALFDSAATRVERLLLTAPPPSRLRGQKRSPRSAQLAQAESGQRATKCARSVSGNHVLG